MTGRVLTVFGNKGGTGKSMTAVHLAVSLMDRGRRVIAVDLDARQGDTKAFFEARGQEQVVAIPNEVEELLELFENAKAQDVDVVVDCPPADSPMAMAAAEHSDGTIYPFLSGANDARSLGRAIRIATQTQQPGALFCLVNKYKNTNDARALVAMLGSVGVFTMAGVVGDRNAFNSALRAGRTVWEMNEDAKAVLEMRAICDNIHRVMERKR